MGYLTASGFGLNDRQIAFVNALAETGDKVTAVSLAGYSDGGNPSYVAGRLLGTPAVQAALHHEVRRHLAADATIARRVLREIALDATAPKGVRVDAAKAILDRAGFVAPRNGAEQGGTLDLASMSPDQLRAFISQGEQELAVRSRTGSAPDALVSTLDVIDLLD